MRNGLFINIVCCNQNSACRTEICGREMREISNQLWDSRIKCKKKKKYNELVCTVTFLLSYFSLWISNYKVK